MHPHPDAARKAAERRTPEVSLTIKSLRFQLDKLEAQCELGEDAPVFVCVSDSIYERATIHPQTYDLFLAEDAEPTDCVVIGFTRAWKDRDA